MSKSLADRLVDKSIEAFILGLEIYNKPTIKYRVEGFAFFICNAWELMLKAHLIRRDGEKSIYYDDPPDRTISLSDAISRVYTDVKQPLRINLEEIITLRHQSTHFITEDHETLYTPFFQSCVFNFCEQMKRFHNIEITDFVSQNFLVLSVNISILTNEEIKAKYSEETAKKFIKKRDHLQTLKQEYSTNDLYIPIRVELYQTKNKNKADALYAIDQSSDDSVRTITREIDPKDKYHLTRKNIISGVNKQLNSRSINFNYYNTKGDSSFNDYTLSLIMDYYNLYDKYSYSFEYVTRYSQQIVDVIVDIIRQNPNIIQDIRDKKR